jgi:preprotein translocase subunit SecE
MALKAERLKTQAMSNDAPEPRSGAGALTGLWDRIKAVPQRWGGFLHEVRVEMRQVTWPSRDDVMSTTAVVIVAVAFFGVFFFGVDTTVGFLLARLLRLFGH